MPETQPFYIQSIRDYQIGDKIIPARDIEGFFELNFEPEKLHLIDTLARQIEALKQQDSIFSQVDLVVEGAVGSGDLLREVIRLVYPYPQTSYVGMDLNPVWKQLYKPRFRRQIDEVRVLKIDRDNQTSIPTLGGSSERVCANCFDYDLITDLAHKLNRRHPLLVSLNALGALSDPFSFGPGDDDIKDLDDRQPVEDWFLPESPYVAHLHLFHEPIRFKSVSTGKMVLRYPFEDLITKANQCGARVVEIENGIVFQRQ